MGVSIVAEQETFERDPNNVIEFLKAFVTPVWMLETGLSRTGDFERQQYDALKELVDQAEVHNALEKIYGKEMSTSDGFDMNEVDVDRRIAAEFESLYQQLTKDQDSQADE